MKRLIPIAIAFAIVAVLVSIKVRARTPDTLEPEGSWELADEDAPSQGNAAETP